MSLENRDKGNASGWKEFRLKQGLKFGIEGIELVEKGSWNHDLWVSKFVARCLWTRTNIEKDFEVQKFKDVTLIGRKK